MILWTMQPIEVWNLIQETGVYRCDPALCSMPEFGETYRWLTEQMKKRIGPPPEGVIYPVWAWYKQNWEHRQPDLRRERWNYGPGDEQYACIEMAVPDNQVLLSDFDAWCIILNDGILTDSREEYERMDSYCDTLSAEDQQTYKTATWEKVFCVEPAESDWERRGEWVQATFWELRREMVRKVRLFKTGKRRRD